MSWYKLILRIYLDGKQIGRNTRRFKARNRELANKRAAQILSDKNDSSKPGSGISYDWGYLDKEVGPRRKRNIGSIRVLTDFDLPMRRRKH